MGILLFIVSIILFAVLTIPAFIASFIIMIVHASKGKFFYEFWKYFNGLFFKAAISLDQFGNVFFQHLFNVALIKNSEHLFGNVDETISSVIGKKKRANTLTKAGKALSWTLDALDENHSLKSIEQE